MTASGASVLVVSPDAELRESVLQWASSIQIPALAARSGAEALERVLAGHAGLIFYNLRADHLSDLVAFARLRELPSGRDLPVVALVAQGDLATARQYGQALGIREYLTTPPSPVDLARQLAAMPVAQAASTPLKKKPAAPPVSYPNYTGPLTLAELRDVHCKMGAMTHFERLGITPTVDTAGVRAAYQHLAGRYVVENLPRPTEDEARHLCRDIYNLLGEAYSILRDPRRRSQYEESRRPRPAADERPATRGRRMGPIVEGARATRRSVSSPAPERPAEPSRAADEPEDLADEATRAAFEALAALEEAERAKAAEPPAPAPEPVDEPPPAPEPSVVVPPRASEVPPANGHPTPEAPVAQADVFALNGDDDDDSESMVPNFDDDIFVFDLPDSGEDELPQRPQREATVEPSQAGGEATEEPESFNPALVAARAQQQRSQAAAEAPKEPADEPIPAPQRERRPAEQVLARNVEDIAAAAFMMALMGRYDSAVPLYERCYTAAPSARLRYDLELCRGRLAVQNGDDDAARRHFQAARNSAPRGRTEAADELEDLGGRKSKGRFSRLFGRE